MLIPLRLTVQTNIVDICDIEGAPTEGLAAYADAALPEAALADLEQPAPLVRANHADPAVLQTLCELLRVAENRHLPTVRDWLRIVVKASPSCVLYSKKQLNIQAQHRLTSGSRAAGGIGVASAS